MIWRVASERFRTWSHFHDAARYWAAVFAEADLLDSSEHKIEARSGVMPRAIARWLTAVTGAPPGLNGSGQYVFPVPNATIVAQVAELVSELNSTVIASLSIERTENL
jgi:hypothetical protein